jgi:hypothetical protein
VSGDLEFGRGEALPSRGRAFALTPRAPDPGDGFCAAQLGAGRPRPLEWLFAERVADTVGECGDFGALRWPGDEPELASRAFARAEDPCGFAVAF